MKCTDHEARLSVVFSTSLSGLNICVLKYLLNGTLNCVFAFLKLVRLSGKMMQNLW